MIDDSISMKDVFITSTLKFEWNSEFNSLICQKLEEKWITCHLPQRDTHQNLSELDKYNQNIHSILHSYKVIVVWMNESINWWLEVGYSFGLGKKIILLTHDDHVAPTMSLGMYHKIITVKNLNDYESYIGELIEIIRE